ncbi:MAG TPA: EAL domain-containing protein [Geminicoccaceae bacterium]|nr:EAL domain-containing protein [Geminicoccaceae bacterium]
MSLRRGSPRERLLALILLIAGAWALDWSAVTVRLDDTILQWQVRWMSPAPAAEVVLVEVDEASLLRLGRWPWPRRIHARLIERLTMAGVRAVGLDVSLAEPDGDDPDGDAALAQAIARAGNIVLPVYARGGGTRPVVESVPMPALAAAAAALGHVHVEVDRDGTARRFSLSGGVGGPRWPGLALAVLETAHAGPELGLRRGQEAILADAPAAQWVANHEIMLSSDATSAGVRRISYADLLEDDAALDGLQDSLVLVGVTGAGFGQRFMIPGDRVRRSSVELQASLVSALRRGTALTPLPAGTQLAWTAVTVALGAAAFVLSRPRLAYLLAALAGCLALDLGLILGARLAFAPGAALVALLLGYAGWGARTLMIEQRLMRREHRRAQVTLRAIADAVITTDAKGAVEFLNPAAEKLLARPSLEARGRPLGEVVSFVDERSGERAPWPPPELDRASQRNLLPPHLLLVDARGERHAVRATAAPLYRRRAVTGVVLAVSDVSAERRLMGEISRRASHDALTGLANRALLRDRLERALARTRRRGGMVAVVFLDLDRFKAVNDALGHAVGDALLVEVTARLLGVTRESDTLARLGGDEFVIVLEGLNHEAAMLAIVRRYVAALGEPILVGGYRLHVGASFGISLFPRDGDDVDTLLRNADIAMYRAKDSGRGRIRFFAEEMNRQAVDRLVLDQELRQALERDEFEVHYQPQVELGRDRIVGVEGLVRWRHPRRGLLTPSQFVPLAEDSGLICPIGRAVLTAGCRRLAGWQRLAPSLRLAVNLSVVQLKADDGLVEFVDRTLRASGLEPGRLELEITESLFVDPGLPILAQRLQDLVALGVRLSIDDFGTGYSSLAYLKRFPFDRIKIDRSFVHDVEADSGARAIVQTIIALGHSLEKTITAEGVETGAQLEFLRHQRCDEAQGFLFGRPVEGDGIAPLLAA